MNNKINKYILFQGVNPVIKLFIASDIMFLMGRLGLMAPLFAVFITDQIEDGNLEVVGVATTIFLLSKSLLQIPISALTDRVKGEIDDFWVMFAGSVVFALVPLMFLLVENAWQLYLVQFIFGLSAAMVFPTWMAIFTRHIDKEHEGVEWSLYFSTTDIAVAAAATLGGVVAYRYGFAPLFVMASVVCFFGLIILYGIKDYITIKK